MSPNNRRPSPAKFQPRPGGRNNSRGASAAAAYGGSYQSNARRSERTSCTEFVQNLNGTNSATPGVTSFQFNPGLSKLFPRLSVEAAVWETYTVHSAKVVYRAACSTQTPGSVILSVDYDASESPPTTEQQLLNTAGAISGNSWDHLEMKLDHRAMMGHADRLYVRDSAVAGDLKTYDACMINVATVNSGGTGIMGKLWIEYDISFQTPQVASTLTSKKSAFFYLSGTQNMTTATPAAIQYDTSLYNPLEIGNSSGVFTLPKGVWRVDVNAEFRDSSAEAFASEIHLLVDGSEPTPRRRAKDNRTNIASGNVHMSLSSIVVSDGTTTLAVEATLTGAAGTLTCYANENSIILSPI